MMKRKVEECARQRRAFRFEQSAANMLVLFRAGGDVGWREVHSQATEEGPDYLRLCGL